MKDTLPLIEELDANLSPLSLYTIFLEEEMSFWLDTSLPLPRYGRFSFMGGSPFLVYKTRGRECLIKGEKQNQRIQGDPLEVLQRLLKEYQIKRTAENFPFIGGAIGYLSYDLGRELEVLPDDTEDDLELPHIYLGFYDTILLVDHKEKRNYLCSFGISYDGFSLQKAQMKVEEIKERLKNLPQLSPIIPTKRIKESQIISNFSKDEYINAVSKTKDYIGAGDIFQANISQRFQAPLPLKPFDIYRILRHKNPAPFSAYLHFPEFQIASSSPERFIELREDRLQTRPIKGTRPRGHTLKEDELMKKELAMSSKDKAENVMIVDLERNDFGRIASFGSVRVDELYRIEEFATVFHLVSTVSAKLKKGLTLVDVIRHTFPGGYITGAPKIRAMEIIEELEPFKRNIYTGSIGYLDFRGDMDLNIVIRTFILKDKMAYFQVGGGIVADSIPEKEYQETLDKGKALMDTLLAGCWEEVSGSG